MKLHPANPARAFTLLETMIAIMIFFMCIFGVLEIISQNLKAARLLQKQRPNVGVLPAKFGMTNILQEGTFDIPLEEFPNSAGTASVTQMSSNGLFKVDFTLTDRSVNPPVSEQLSVLFYRPDSQQAAFGGKLTLPNRGPGR
ncbi:MAG: hypothetical protein HY300_03415 [Verrucomicrobia bacterium]|nr:hypothetical protein [Verrucomicrobiota bacterium]